MDRRRFISHITGATAVGAAANLDRTSARNASDETHAGNETRQVIYDVKGFSCITCAVGLEAMLRGFRGVTRAEASYPEHTVTIAFDEHVTNEDALEKFIGACGFSVV